MTQSNSPGVALVTGASAGIGSTYADRLARRGHDLILVARDAARLEDLAVKLRAETGVAVEVFRADLTDKADLVRLENRLASDEAIDLVVNNAGAVLAGSFLEQTPEQADGLIQLNVVAVARLANAAAKAFVRRGHGTLVNVGSVVGLLPEYRSTVYGATKAFVLYLTQGLNQEIGGAGVTLQAVLPGATRTEIWERSGRKLADLDPNRTMDAGELVDAALAGLDKGELVTIPSLLDPAEWDAFEAARVTLSPNLSHAHPAPRYGVKVPVAA
ncbi:SDR family NAD(P)-dependent oxidoreductase [Phenylobacterium sp.]|uniref:SDR family NAD(P)-dependent oxidoreductase n=1 Tax=Phenylobacterium sp. TaxID=1871053 RepID=UPI0035651A1C